MQDALPYTPEFCHSSNKTTHNFYTKKLLKYPQPLGPTGGDGGCSLHSTIYTMGL